MLLVLNRYTFQNDELTKDILMYQAHAGTKILLVHQPEPVEGGCEFGKCSTMRHFVKHSGLFRNVAQPCYSQFPGMMSASPLLPDTWCSQFETIVSEFALGGA